MLALLCLEFTLHPLPQALCTSSSVYLATFWSFLKCHPSPQPCFIFLHTICPYLTHYIYLSHLFIALLSVSSHSVPPQDFSTPSISVGGWGASFLRWKLPAHPCLPESRTLPSLPPAAPPLTLPTTPAQTPSPPFRVRAESAWVNLAAYSAGAGASPRLSRGVLARPSAPPLPPPPPSTANSIYRSAFRSLTLL